MRFSVSYALSNGLFLFEIAISILSWWDRNCIFYITWRLYCHPISVLCGTKTILIYYVIEASLSQNKLFFRELFLKYSFNKYIDPCSCDDHIKELDDTKGKKPYHI